MMFITYVVIVLSLVLSGVPSVALALVVETNEWVNRTRTGWEYSTTNAEPTLDASPACGASPSGGGAIRGSWVPQTSSSSIPGGTSRYVIPANQSYTELYYGVWFCVSNPFEWHPIGTKIMFNTNRDPAGGNIAPTGRDNFVVVANPGGNGIVVVAQLWWTCPGVGCTRSWSMNKGSITIQTNRWYWLEAHAKMNTIGNGNSSSQDGVIEVWIDDNILIQHTNAVLRTSNTVFGDAANVPMLGGGQLMTIHQNQYMWYDHNVVSTTRIFRPGGNPQPGDTTAPSSPTVFTVQ